MSSKVIKLILYGTRIKTEYTLSYTNEPTVRLRTNIKNELYPNPYLVHFPKQKFHSLSIFQGNESNILYHGTNDLTL